MKDLTLEQLEEQVKAINTARFLMERTYNASESTVNELEAVLKQLNQEIDSRYNVTE